MSALRIAARVSRGGWRACAGGLDRVMDGLAWLRARRLFQRCGLFAALPLTGSVLEVEGDRGHLAEAAVHHIPNRRCFVVDSARGTRPRVDRRVRRRKFHRVCAPPDRLPFADAAFDAAWTSFSLARLDPAAQERTLREMVRVVRPGGVLVAIERVPDTAWRRLRARWGEAAVPSGPGGKRCYRAAGEWRAALSRNGWVIEAEHRFDEAGRSRCGTFICRRRLPPGWTVLAGSL